MTTWKFAVTGLAVAAVLGCAPGRVADLRDSGRLGIGFGPGLSVDAKLGDLTHPALGLFGASAMWGWESREIEGFWYEGAVSDPFSIYWYRRADQSWKCALISSGWRGTWEALDFFDAVDEFDDPIDRDGLPETDTFFEGEILRGRVYVSRWLPIPGCEDELTPLFGFQTATDLQAGAHLLLINARAGFNPLEFLHFLLGFAGIDLPGDDPAP